MGVDKFTRSRQNRLMEKLMTPRKIPFAWISGKTARAICAGLAILAATWPGTAPALVTSDGVGTHVVAPGVPAFGVNLDGVVGIGNEAFGFLFGTGALISDTHVLTAAHVVELGPFLFSVRFDLPDGPVWIPVKGYAIHPGYDPAISDDHDVAVLELASPAPAGVPRYELHTGSDEVGKAAVLTGYGRSGSGATGDTLNSDSKRAGLNRFEATGADILAKFPEAANIALNNLYADFDSGLAANDLTPLVTGSADLGFGDEEVCLAPGDSGGPAFIDGGDGVFRIAGINGARLHALDFPSFDVSPGMNSSWGEFMSWARVSTNLSFINDAVAGNLRRQRIFDDGLTHVIDDGLDAGPVFVVNSPAPDDAVTTVRLVDAVVRSLPVEEQGLVVGGSSLVELVAGLIEGSPAARVWEGGRLHVSGGTIRALPNSPDVFIDDSWAIFANQNAEVHVSGGTIEGVRSAVTTDGNSKVFITGGTFTAEDQAISAAGRVEIDGGSFHGDANGARSIDSSMVTISNGTFTGGSIGFEATETSEVLIRGGTFTGDADFGLQAHGNADVRIFGGSFSGGTLALRVQQAAVVKVHGYGFNLPLGPVNDASGTISGFYFDGTPVSLSFDRDNDSVIELVSSYDTWAAYHGLEGDDALTTVDANGNGIPNVLELVLGGNPAAGSTPPTIGNALVRENAGDGEQDYFKLTFPVTQLSVDFGAESFVEYGTDLASASWTKAIHGTDGVIITTTTNGFSPGVHRVEVRIPKSLAPDGRLFARIGGSSL